jgi:hypothetical protein
VARVPRVTISRSGMARRCGASSSRSVWRVEADAACPMGGMSCPCRAASRALVTSTYAAGELRRYWDFAAALAAGTSLGPPHPPVTEIASTFAARLPSYSLALSEKPGTALSDLLDTEEIAA